MTSPAPEMRGRRFGRWTVVERAGSKAGRATWLCICDCGTTAVRSGKVLRAGRTRSCGCSTRMDTTAKVTYGTAHQRLRRKRGPASTYICADCPAPATNWSYNHSEAMFEQEQAWTGGNGHTSILRYHPDPAYYSPRCLPCHRSYDAVQAHWDLELDPMLGREAHRRRSGGGLR